MGLDITESNIYSEALKQKEKVGFRDNNMRSVSVSDQINTCVLVESKLQGLLERMN